MFRRLSIACLVLMPLIATGCASYADRLREVRSSFYAGSVETASIELDKYAGRYSREAEVLKLDRAIVELTAGRPKNSEKILREVRDVLDHNAQTSLLESAGSMLTDDTHTAYPGEDYEKILVRAFLALSNLMNGGDDANAYALQVSDFQERVIQSGADASGQNPKLAYQRVALGEYIHGMLQEANHMDFNDAARSWMKVCSWEKGFPYGPMDVDRALHGHHSQRGNGVVYVFTLVGRGPYKQEAVEVPTTVAMFLATAILANNSRHAAPISIAPIKVPKVVVHPNSMNTVYVSVDQRQIGTTATITDVGQLAVQQYQAIYPKVIARAVVRRALKEAIVYGAKEGIKSTNRRNDMVAVAAEVGGLVGAFAWEAAESADTRCWGLLPDRIQVLRLELPAGDHRIGLHATGGYSGGSPEAEKLVHVADGRNTYVLGTFADGRLIGNILSSDNAAPLATPMKVAQHP